MKSKDGYRVSHLKSLIDRRFMNLYHIRLSLWQISEVGVLSFKS